MIIVDLPHACFGLIVHNQRVVDAPPIARWAVGKPARQVWDYYRGRGKVGWVN